MPNHVHLPCAWETSVLGTRAKVPALTRDIRTAVNLSVDA